MGYEPRADDTGEHLRPGIYEEMIRAAQAPDGSGQVQRASLPPGTMALMPARRATAQDLARDACQRLRRQLEVAPLRHVIVTASGARSPEQIRSSVGRLLDSFDNETGGYELLTRLPRYKLTPPEHFAGASEDDTGELGDLFRQGTEINRAFEEVRLLARRVLDHRRQFRAAIEFLLRNLDPRGPTEPVADFYCAASDDERPTSFLSPPSERSVLRLLGTVQALGADGGKAFLDFETTQGMWRVPTTPNAAAGVLTHLHSGAPIEMMAMPGIGTIYWSDSPPGSKPPPSEKARTELLFREWREALDRLAK